MRRVTTNLGWSFARASQSASACARLVWKCTMSKPSLRITFLTLTAARRSRSLRIEKGSSRTSSARQRSKRTPRGWARSTFRWPLPASCASRPKTCASPPPQFFSGSMCRIFSRRRSSLPPKFFPLLQLELPELSILEKNVNRGGHRHVKPGEPFEAAALQNIGAKKTRRRPEQGVAPVPAPALLLQLARGDRGEAIDALHVIVHAAVGQMMQRMAEPAHGAVDDNFFVRIGAAPGGALAPKQAHVVIGIPAAAPPPAVEIINQARHRVAGVAPAVARKRVFDFALQLGAHPLVGVDQKHPAAARLGMGEGFLIAIARPRPLDEFHRVLAAYLRRAIGAEGVHDHDLVAPAEAFQTGADAVFLVEADHDGGNRRRGLILGAHNRGSRRDPPLSAAARPWLFSAPARASRRNERCAPWRDIFFAPRGTANTSRRRRARAADWRRSTPAAV